MAGNPTKQEFPSNIHDKLAELQGKVALLQWAPQIWEELLDEPGRQRLGGNLEECLHTLGGTVRIWMKAKDVSQPRAIVDLAWDLGFLAPADHQRLLREIGETDNHADTQARPRWNRDRGELSFHGNVVRRIRSISVAKNIVAVLDAFEVEGWPDRIDDPLPKRSDPQRLRETVANLNQNLRCLRFRADGTGQGIVWEPR